MDPRSGAELSIVRLVEKATDSTDREVDPKLMTAIKYAVRTSDDALRASVETLMSKMKKDHSQVIQLIRINIFLFYFSCLVRILAPGV